ncbi:MAG: ATP synthase F0 subunit B [Blastocatellia bacterium]|nr:ATP synthase F0 subunit B [Blastocatellia bacterium]
MPTSMLSEMLMSTFQAFFFYSEGLDPVYPKTVNLLIFLTVAIIILRKPLSEALSSRRTSIQEELQQAKKEKLEAEAKLHSLEERLSKLDQEIAEIRANAEKEAKAEYDRLIRQSNEEAERIKQSAQREISGAVKTAQNQLREFAAEKAVELAEKLILQEIKPEDNRRLVAEFSKELEGVKR